MNGGTQLVRVDIDFEGPHPRLEDARIMNGLDKVCTVKWQFNAGYIRVEAERQLLTCVAGHVYGPPRCPRGQWRRGHVRSVYLWQPLHSRGDLPYRRYACGAEHCHIRWPCLWMRQNASLTRHHGRARLAHMHPDSSVCIGAGRAFLGAMPPCRATAHHIPNHAVRGQPCPRLHAQARPAVPRGCVHERGGCSTAYAFSPH